MDSLFDALGRLAPLLRGAMLVAILIIIITGCLHLKQWKEEYKTMGNVPVEEFINIAAIIYLGCAMYRQVNREDAEKDKIRLIRIALHEHDKEKA